MMMQGGESNPSLSSSSSSPAAAGAATPPTPSIGIGMGMGKGGMNRNRNRKKKLPTPREMVAHYESKGMQTQEASLKVIDDLQNLLLRVVVNNNSNNPTNPSSPLKRLESKLDSKPGYPQTLAIGIVSGSLVTVFPQLAASVAHIWNSVTSSTSTST